MPESATFEAIQTQELDDDSLLKDTLSVTVKGDEKLLDAEYMAVKSYTGNAQTFDMYRIVTDTTPDKSMSFTGMSLAPYELNGHIIQDLRPVNQTISYTLNRVLDGTDWRVGYIEDGLSNVTTTFYYVSAKEALKELQSLIGCEFVFKVEISGQKITDKWIEVYKEMGNRTKKRFNYGTNALTVVRETNKADIYTALIGRGKGEEVTSADENESGQAGYGRKITFEGIEWSTAKGNPLNKPIGQYYLELPQATQAYGIKNIDGTMKARVGIVDFDDEEDKNRLINLTYQQLLVSSRPKVLFKTTVANIGATGIGDTVTIHRHDLNIHYQTRVRKIVRNKLNDNKTQIELGDAVVTASTKQAKQNNTTIKSLNQEIEKVKADVNTSQTSADGKNTIFYGPAEPERQRTGDTWYRPHPSIAGERQMLVWNGSAWELVIDTSDLTSVSRAVEDAAGKANEAVQSAKDADTRANEAIEKAGANAELLTAHQNTIDTINSVTLPDISSTAETALSDAKSAMDEAKLADGKIADYVTTNGLVSGTTVDSKINEATGEISKKITTVESKIPTELGGRNLIANTELPSGYLNTYLNFGVMSSTYSGTTYRDTFTGQTTIIPKGEDYVVSFYAKASANVETYCYFYEPNSTIQAVSSTGQTSSATDGTIGVSITTEWQRYWVRWKQNPANTTTKKSLIIGRNINVPSGTVVDIAGVKLEQGTIPSDWTQAPEDNYTKQEFSIFERTYDENVRGINSSLTDLSNKKLDGTTYTNFYNNDYKITAQGVTDAWTAVNKIIDANGNSTDTFAKAVYDKNAERQTAAFQSVTSGLVKTATYEDGINGVKDSITTIQGDIKSLANGGTNLITGSDKVYTWANSSIIATDGINIDELVDGEEYTFSFDIRSTTANYISSLFINNSINGLIPNSPIGTEWTRLSAKFKWVESSKYGEFDIMPHFYPGNDYSGTHEVKNVKLEKGGLATPWTPALEDMLGKADFQIFKNTYESNDKVIQSRLLAIDSSEEGSVVTRLNATEKTAKGNTTTISDIKTKPGEQIIGYQTIKERSDLYERVIGSTSEDGVKSNISRAVQASGIIQSEVASAVPNPNLLSGTDFKEGLGDVGVYNRTPTLSEVSYFPYGKVATINTPETSGTANLGFSVRIPKKDMWYTLSFYGSTDWIGSSGVSFYSVYMKDSKNYKAPMITGLAPSRHKIQITVQVSQDDDLLYVRPQGNSFGAYSNIVFYGVKLEVGEVATPWENSDPASSSKITQLADNINLKVSKGDLLSQINVQANSVLIQSGTNKLNVTPTTTYIEDSTIKSAMIESLEADKIKTGTLDASKVSVVNLDANNITANKTAFIQSNWNDISSSIRIDAGGLLSTASDGSQVYLQDGIVGARNPNGATIGQIGYAYQTESPWYTMQTSYGSHFQIRMNRGAGELNKQAFYIISGGTESYLNTDNIYLNPASSGRVRVQGAMTVDGVLRTEGTALVRSKLEYLNGGYIESQAANSNMVIGATNKLIIYTNGTNALEFDANNAVFRRKVSENSDIRLKTNIVDMPIDSLDAIRNIEIKKFDYLDGRTNYYGIIAQQAQQYLPELINTDSEGYLMVDKSAMTYVNMHAIQQLDSKVDNKVEQLEAKIANLQDELSQLKGDRK